MPFFHIFLKKGSKNTWVLLSKIRGFQSARSADGIATLKDLIAKIRGFQSAHPGVRSHNLGDLIDKIRGFHPANWGVGSHNLGDFIKQISRLPSTRSPDGIA